jgi:hypothetical protein
MLPPDFLSLALRREDWGEGDIIPILSLTL